LDSFNHTMLKPHNRDMMNRQADPCKS